MREVRGGSKEVFPRGVEEEFDISRDAPWARQEVVFKAGFQSSTRRLGG